MGGKFYAGKVEEKTFKNIRFQVKQLENMVIIYHSEYIKKSTEQNFGTRKSLL